MFVTKEDLKKELKKYPKREEIQTMFRNFSTELIDFITPSLKKIDEIHSELKAHNDVIDNHERRIEKLEDKVFAT